MAPQFINYNMYSRFRTLSPALAGLLLAVAPPCVAEATQANGAAGFDSYPEFAPAHIVPPIIEALKAELVDARSVRELVVCPPVKIRYAGEPRRPVGWTVMISLETKNAEGGYTGPQVYGAIFRQGKRVSLAPTMMATNEGLDGIIFRAIKNQMVNCPSFHKISLKKCSSVRNGQFSSCSAICSHLSPLRIRDELIPD